jgi:hypothetical protein
VGRAVELFGVSEITLWTQKETVSAARGLLIENQKVLLWVILKMDGS